MKKLFLSFALLTLSVGMWAETQKVSYRSPWVSSLGDATTITWSNHEVEATVITNETSSLSEGWYVVTGEDVRTGTLSCSGDVRLILADGAKLTATGTSNKAGIQVSGDGNSLAVYAQSTGEQMGQLIAKGGGYGAGIGGGNYQSGSNITINGGRVTATGNVGSAGIGGGANGEGSNITINGGIVNATGSATGYDNTCGAGIGGANKAGHHITINGGTVTATGKILSAGIGGGTKGIGHDIAITGGFVTAIGSPQGAGIGAGTWEGAYNITISGGMVVASIPSWGPAAIGGGDGSREVHHISITGGAVIATDYSGNTAIGRGTVGDPSTTMHDVFVSSSLFLEANGELIEHNSNEDITTAFYSKENVRIYTYQPVDYGEYISVDPSFSSGDQLKGGTEITFTATNRESECKEMAFFSDHACTKEITEGVSGYTYTTYVSDKPVSVYVNYKDPEPTVTYGEYITVGPDFNSGDVVTCGTTITFTATDREADGYKFVGFFSDPECKNAITDGVSDLTYTTTLEIHPISVYVQYKLSRFPVTYGENITVSPSFTSGQGIDTGTQLTFTAADRTLEDYIFSGFFSDPEYKNPITEGVSGSIYTVMMGYEPISVYVRYSSHIADVNYLDTDGVQKTCTEAYVIASSFCTEVWDKGWYVVKGTNVELSKGAVCQGDVHLILADGAKLTITGGDDQAGIQVSGDGNSLTIYGQTAQLGQLIVKGGMRGAGIGGGNNKSGSNITINGGIVTATGGIEAAGIGGGNNKSGSYITINGGKVTATGGKYAAGIGGGDGGSGSHITINGGEVTATGKSVGAGIGGGSLGSGTDITINAGTVTATGGKGATGIGSSNITINGGIVTANGGEEASGIGNFNITINGGIVTANGGSHGAGIGGCKNQFGSNITINGGTVTATGKNYAAGIGSGSFSSGSKNITISGGTVIANGGEGGDCIGSGQYSEPSSDIFIDNECTIKAGESETLTEENIVVHTSTTDLADALKEKRYAMVTFNKYDMNAEDIVIISNSATYDGEAQSATVTFREGITGAGNIIVTYKQGDEEVTPINVGVYDIYVAVGEGERYKALETTKLDDPLTITKATLTPDDFIYDAPDIFYDGNEKTATVTFNSQEGKLTGCGDITIKYNGSSEAPSAAGEYIVSIDVTEGDNYNAVTGLTGDNWKFTIVEPVSVSYIDEEGKPQTAEALELMSTNKQITLKAGWYVVDGTNVELSKGAVCQGAVHLILADGAKLTATGIDNNNISNTPGIQVSGSDNSLTIYGQEGQSGQLIANSAIYAAGIGGGCNKEGSNITINGGMVTATGGKGAAGIGGGNQGKGSNITINGGTVTATGGFAAAGIGGGFWRAGDITINGGTVTANGGEDASGIGGGNSSNGSNILVATSLIVKAESNNPPTTVIENDGSNLAVSLKSKRYATVEPPAKANLTAADFVIGNNSATYDGEAQSATVIFREGITGAGNIIVTYKQGDEEVTPINVGVYDIYVAVTAGVKYNAFPATKLDGQLTITKAALTVDNFIYNAPDIFYDGNEKTATVTFNDQGKLTGCGKISIKYQQDNVEVSPINVGEYTVSIAVAEGDNYYATTTDLTKDEWKFTIVAPASVLYIDEKGESQTVDAWELTNTDQRITLKAGWYVVEGTNVELSKGAICQGAVHLILADDAKLTITAEKWQSGIKVSGDGNSLTIYGQTAQSGQLIANGGGSGAGIGGGYHQDGSNIIINGGIVTATGGSEAAGIGGGSSYTSSTTIQGSNITINAGTVTATGGYLSAGIGGGNRGSGSNITINGGIVKATGANSGSGIGGGNQGHGSNITINGGTVEATGGSSGAGIGGGYKGGKGFDITIKGGVVIAKGGNHAAGIGGGNMGIGYNITISGGTVTATGGTDIAGIGIGEIGEDDASVAYNIFVATKCIVKAGESETLTDGNIVAHTSITDLASDLAGKRYATVETPAKITLSAADFTVTEDGDWTYDNTEKRVNVELNPEYIMPSADKITIYYNNDRMVKQPINPGTYQVYIDIEETDIYAAVTGITSEAWKFDIIDPLPEIKAAAIAEINAAATTAKAEIDGLGVDESAKSEAKAQIDNIVNTAEATINAATSKDAIDKAKTEAIADIYNVVQTTKNMWVTVRTGVTANDYGTLCWKYNLTAIEGAELYTIAGKENNRIVLEEVKVKETQAGAGYVILATAETLRVKNGDQQTDTPLDAADCNGLQGTFAEIVDGATGAAGNTLEGNYIVYNNEWRLCGGYTGLRANCAYLILDEIPNKVPIKAPNRKYISMPLPGGTPTGNSSLHHSNNSSFKMIKDGQFVIIKDNKMYNAQGIEL